MYNQQYNNMYQPAIRGLDFCSSNGQLSSLFRFFPEQPESESLLESTWCLYHDELWLQYNFHCTHGSELLNIDCVCIINFNFAKKKKKKKKEGGDISMIFVILCFAMWHCNTLQGQLQQGCRGAVASPKKANLEGKNPEKRKEKQTKTKSQKLTTIQFTNGSNLISFSPFPNFSEDHNPHKKIWICPWYFGSMTIITAAMEQCFLILTVRM